MTPHESDCDHLSCRGCLSDLTYLQRIEKPRLINRVGRVTAVDLFCGCGGMSVGLFEAARRAYRSLEIPLAVDSHSIAAATFQRNFPKANVRTDDVLTLFNGTVGRRLSTTEKALKEKVGPVDILMGGPPCQGHSDLNNYTRRDDTRNDLYLVMARAASALNPKVVVIENVAAVEHDEAGIVDVTVGALERAGYEVDHDVVDLRLLGVPQRRKRHLLIASRIQRVEPSRVLDRLFEGIGTEHPDRTVSWAIDDLRQVPRKGPFDNPGALSKKNRQRIKYLFSNHIRDLPNARRPKCHHDDHSYNSMYGRLSWNEPAQTITTGFGSMGQGRYVHPSQQRTITPHEAARLQTFPDWFDFGEDAGRGALAEMIGNAVPPLLMVNLGALLMPPPPRSS